MTPKSSTGRPCPYCKGKTSDSELSEILIKLQNLNKRVGSVERIARDVSDDTKELKTSFNLKLNTEKDSEEPVALLSNFPLKTTDCLNTFFEHINKDDRQSLVSSNY